MHIKKLTVANLVEKLNLVDKQSRRKNLTAEELSTLLGDAIRSIRSTLSILRKLK